jgi:radical SAM protein with 4Fe4S-binding SPASM domain
MELIIKPTEACNFKCTFCSSTDITEDKAARLDLNYVWQFLERYPETKTIIVNGGDPLMVPPDYYWQMIEWLDKHNYSETTISFTSNLWAFYKAPDKWSDLLGHPRVGVATSFNYGETRRVTAEQNYTEELFWKVSDLFLDRIGYRPDFISVITDENEATAIDNVKLAQRMNVDCKLNYAMASGIQSKPYQLSKIYKTYVEIYNQGLWPWEFNTRQMMHRLNNASTCCPQNRQCDNGIRALNPSGDYYSCGSFGDDRLYPIEFHREMKGEFITPLRKAPELLSVKEECLTCPMFEICNGCKKTIRDLKMHNMVESHCSLMKQLANDIIRINRENIGKDNLEFERTIQKEEMYEYTD